MYHNELKPVTREECLPWVMEYNSIEELEDSLWMLRLQNGDGRLDEWIKVVKERIIELRQSHVQWRDFGF